MEKAEKNQSSSKKNSKKGLKGIGKFKLQPLYGIYSGQTDLSPMKKIKLATQISQKLAPLSLQPVEPVTATLSGDLGLKHDDNSRNSMLAVRSLAKAGTHVSAAAVAAQKAQ